VPRLKAHGADLDRVFIFSTVPDGKGGTRLLNLPYDLVLLENKVIQREAKLLIIDPVMTMLGGDANKDQDARKALTPVRDMAEGTGVAVIAVRHLNKSVGLKAIQRGGGNMGLIGVKKWSAVSERWLGSCSTGPGRASVTVCQPASRSSTLRNWKSYARSWSRTGPRPKGTAMGRRELKRLLRLVRGDAVVIEQTDATRRTFPASVFWRELTLGEIAAVTGETPDTAVYAALENATPEARARVEELVEAEGGDFLIRATADGFGIVDDAPPDLSEPSETDEDGY